MNKKYIFVVVVLILVFIIYLVYKFNFFWIWRWLITDYYIANKTWDTEYTKEVFYKKWDELEYIYILNNTSDTFKRIEIDTWKIEQLLNLSDLNVEKSSDIISWNSSMILKFNWIALGAWWTKEELFKDIEKFIRLIDIAQQDIDLINPEDEQKPQIIIEKSDIDISLEKDVFISDIDNLIKITWIWLEWISSIWIWDKFFKLLSKNNEYYILIPAKTFPDWNYFVIVVLNSWDIIAQNKTVEFNLDWQEVVITSILPNQVENNIPRWITLQWDWFSGAISVQLSNNFVFKKTSFKIVSNSVMAVEIPAWLGPWKYFINIMTFAWIFEFPDYGFDVIE